MKRIFGLFVLTAIFSIAAFADVRLPDTPNPTPAKTAKPEAAAVDSKLHVVFSKSDKTARLVVPRNQLNRLRAELGGLEAGGASVFSGVSRAQTVAGGLFLTLALVFGGVWFVRSGKNAAKKVKIAAAGALLFASGALASIAFANIGPPTTAEITSRIFNAESFRHPLGVRGAVKLEIIDDSDQILLVVPYVEQENSK